MSRVVPAFPLLPEPAEWDELSLLAATIYLEAEGEPMEGKVGVGWVIRHRMEAWKLPMRQVILGPDGKAWGDGRPYEPWSCWGDDYRKRGAARLAAAAGPEVEAAWRAAAGTLWRLLPDTVDRATFYLNVEVTRKLRKGTLPDWAADPADKTQLNRAKVTAVLGRHTFLRA